MHPRPRKVSDEQRDRLIHKLKDLLQGRTEVLLALLHGSFMTGGPFRDVDIALLLDSSSIGREGFREYELEQGVRWSLDLGMPIDVRLLNDAPVTFRYHALKGTVLLVRDMNVLEELRARTWDDYFDFAPFARRYLREVMSG